jgi:ADP-ribose pyrophosphatase YjhB (NUDIX family)
LRTLVDPNMKFCTQCASPVALRVPDGDTMARHVCEACGEIHYQNPKIVAGCIPEWEGKILLCRRAIEPRNGLWTIPAGFMENGETVEQAAARETWEEACAHVEINGLYAVFNIPHVNQVYMIFRAALKDETFAPGIESLETGLFEEAEIPWSQMAFPVVVQSLERYFSDRQRDHFPTFLGTLEPIKR